MRNYRLKRLIVDGKRSRTWYVVWSEKGRYKRRSTGTDIKAKAEAWREQFIHEQDRPKENFDLSDIFDGYEQDRIEDGRNANNLKTSLKPLRMYFGKKNAQHVTQAEIRRYKAHRGEKVTSCTRELLTLRAALKWAYSEGWTEHYRPFAVSANRNPRKRFMSQDEFDCLYEAADSIRLKTFLSIAINTAARSTKIYDLKWSDIDFENRLIYFGQGQANKKSRTVPMNDTLAWRLMGALLMATGDYVIEYRGGRVKGLRRPFRNAIDAAGLSDIRIHDLRRTSASWMLQKGATLETVAKVLDDSIEVVERHYGHLAPRHMRDATDLLG